MIGIKRIISLLMFFVLIFCIGVTCLAAADFDNLDRSMRDFERQMKMQKQQQDFKVDIKKFEPQKLPKEDKAVAASQKLFEDFLEERKFDAGKNLEDWQAGFRK